MEARLELGVVTAPVVWPAPDYTSAAASLGELFASLGLNAANPLGRWIRPGMRVLIKPNWVKHEFGETTGRDVLFTHVSLIRALLDAALTATGARGHISVADAPLQGCDFERFRRQSGLAQLEREYSGAPASFLDLRQQWAEIDDASSFVRALRALPGDPRGYTPVDLGARSRLACFGSNPRFGVTDYPPGAPPGRYLVGNSVLDADVILNVPKLKTHMKTGMTGALKNFVGIIGAKDCLPHFRAGAPGQGGDEYPDRHRISRLASPARALLQTRAPLWLWKLARAGAACAPRPAIHGGGWYGNDTLWRTVHDLVDIARNYAAGGGPRRHPRPILTLVDAIVAGEGHGPLRPRPKHCGRLVWGEDPGMVDVTCAAMMGFDWRKIPLLAHLCDPAARAFTEFGDNTDLPAPDCAWNFTPPAGWAGQIELAPPE